MAGLQLVLSFVVVLAAAVLVLMLLEAGIIKEARAYLTRRAARRRRDDAPTALLEPPPPVSSGHATTPLKPFGRIKLAGVEHPAKSEFGYVEAGMPVKVIREDGGVFTVRADS